MLLPETRECLALPPRQGGRDNEVSAVGAGETALVTESDQGGDLAETQIAVGDQGTSMIQAPPLDIGERCHAGQLAKTGVKVPGTKGAESGELLNTDLVGEMMVDPGIEPGEIESVAAGLQSGIHRLLQWLPREVKIEGAQQQGRDLTV
jgi:hypothetical protein